MFPVIDLHCDLLLYLAGSPSRTAYDPISRCSIPQLTAGGVKTQVMAIFTETTAGSTKQGAAQYRLYQKLPKEIDTRLAIENASALFEEGEPLSLGFKRMDEMQPLYITPTWNDENRFGGGARTTVGLKEDGKRLLDALHGKKIAIDLSHSSDALAHEIFDHLDRTAAKIPLIASHSNLRSITNVPRNLPDDLAKELLKRGGIIGLNLIRSFVGVEGPHFFAKHLEKIIQWGYENQVCLGADFFYDVDLSPTSRMSLGDVFFQEFGNAACYPKLFSLCKEELGLSDALLEKLAYKNGEAFLSP